MGTNQHALAALNAKLLVPHWNLLGDIPLLPHCGPGRERAVQGHGTHGEIVSASRDHRANDIAHERRRPLRDGRQNSQPAARHGGNRDLLEMTEGVVHGDKVLGDDSLTAFAVGLTNSVFYGLDRLFAWQNSTDGKKTGLHDGVDAVAHPGLACNLDKRQSGRT